MATKKEAAINEQEQTVQADAAAEAEKILADAKAQAAAILAEAQAKAGEALGNDTAQAAPLAVTDPGEELVSVRLFKDNDKYKDDVFVAVNGERVQLKRGETVQIKRKFADVLDQSMKQDVATANMIERESSAYAAKAAALNI
ncbi:MAG: hypothetical protein VB071_11890 [Lawsonibacter sp.]|nr:hypothetical protein [Lawsonibacter sp.]